MEEYGVTAISTAAILLLVLPLIFLGVENPGSQQDKFDTFESPEVFKEKMSESSTETLDRSFEAGLQSSNPNIASGSGTSVTNQIKRSSDTNTQVSGVSEPDTLKNTGDRIYFSPKQSRFYRTQEPKTSVFNTLPPKNFSETTELPTNGKMFLTNNTLISLGDNISSFDRETNEKLWQEELNASIQSARKIDGKLYFVLRKNTGNKNTCPVKPMSSLSMPCTSFYYPDSGNIDTTYSLVKMDAENGEILNSNGFTGSSSNTVTYVSNNSIYLTYSETVSETEIMLEFLNSEGFHYVDDETMSRIDELEGYDISDRSLRNEIQEAIQKYLNSLEKDKKEEAEKALENGIANYTDKRKRELVTTKIAKFDLNLNLEAEGEVPGEVNDQFSLDESSKGLRIATTVGDSWRFDVKPENDLYTLDEDLQTSGSVTGMGLNEQIYSVRYIDDKAYVVTFRRVDPFHVIDLSDHENPELKGKLKLPGFSSYLHPLQENKVLGIGEEDGKVKAVIFNVENDNPEVLDSLILDDYYSDISNSHHAFQIDRKNKVFFLPGNNGGHFFNYKNSLKQVKKVKLKDAKRGAFVNQNFYVFNNTKASVISMENWRTLKQIQFRENSIDYRLPALPEPTIEPREP